MYVNKFIHLSVSRFDGLMNGFKISHIFSRFESCLFIKPMIIAREYKCSSGLFTLTNCPVVATTKKNTNLVLVFTFLHKIVRVS